MRILIFPKQTLPKMKNDSMKMCMQYGASRGSTIIFIFLSMGVHNGCVSTEAAYALGGATLGGLSGAFLSARNPKIAPLVSAGGAAMGGLMGGMAAQSVKSGRAAAFKEGYQQGASDAVKRQYWILQNLQKERGHEDQWASYQIPINSYGNVQKVSNDVTIPILQ